MYRDALPLVVLAASALARKGAYELAAALRGLRCRLRVLGSPSSDASLWHGIEVEHAGYAGDWIERASVVVLPLAIASGATLPLIVAALQERSAAPAHAGEGPLPFQVVHFSLHRITCT